MGLLDSDDSAIKNTNIFKEVGKARSRVEARVTEFKAKAGSSASAELLAKEVLSIEKAIATVKKSHPDFTGCDEDLAFAKEVAKALCQKFPTPKTHPWADRVRHLAE